MEYFNEGNTHFVNECFEEAIACFDKSLKKQPTHVASLINRAYAYRKLGRSYEALEDLNGAIALDKQSELAHFRKGVVLFDLEEYESAKQCFEDAAALTGNENHRAAEVARYKRKCDAELNSDNISVVPVAKKASASAPSLATTVPSAPAPPTTLAATKTISAATSQPAATRYQYYQSNSSLGISVLAKGRTQDDVTVDITCNHLRVVVKHGGTAGDEVVIDKDLYALVDAEKSTFSIMKTKVEITLVKIEQQTWPTLHSTDGPRLPSVATAEAGVPASAAPAPVPASEPVKKTAYASKKDWDKVSADIDKELAEDKPQGEEAMQALFQQIYKDATPETRMAMKKSFQTSGGTGKIARNKEATCVHSAFIYNSTVLLSLSLNR